MSATNWNLAQPASAVARRAGGRRHYNAIRIARANLRRWDIGTLLREIGFERGYQAELARRLGVSRSTICRDLGMAFEAIRLEVPLIDVEIGNRIRAKIDRQEARKRQSDGK